MYYFKKGKHSKVSNAERIVIIFILGEELQLFVYNNGSTFKISQLIVGPIQRFVLGRKGTLRTLWTYEHHLRLLFMEWHPGDRLRVFSYLFYNWISYLFILVDIVECTKVPPAYSGI